MNKRKRILGVLFLLTIILSLSNSALAINQTITNHKLRLESDSSLLKQESSILFKNKWHLDNMLSIRANTRMGLKTMPFIHPNRYVQLKNDLLLLDVDINLSNPVFIPKRKNILSMKKKKKFNLGEFLLYSGGGAIIGAGIVVGAIYMRGKREDPSNKSLARILAPVFGGIGFFVGSMVYVIRF